MFSFAYSNIKKKKKTLLSVQSESPTLVLDHPQNLIKFLIPHSSPGDVYTPGPLSTRILLGHSARIILTRCVVFSLSNFPSTDPHFTTWLSIPTFPYCDLS